MGEDMANSEHVAMLRDGATGWNRWREVNPAVPPNLRSADLSGADLEGYDLSGALLTESYLTHAKLAGARLQGAFLRGANVVGAHLENSSMDGADLRLVDISEADLTEASLSGANLAAAILTDSSLRRAKINNGATLVRANLSGADLRNADLTGAFLFETIFGNTDLGETTGLSSCRHLGPSTIDHRTVLRSGRLPLTFLRGCGLSEKIVQCILGVPLESSPYHSCFISYATQDEQFAEHLWKDLRLAGVICWFAPADAQTGAKVYSQLTGAIESHDKLLLVLSGGSIKSRWVHAEIKSAVKREQAEGIRMLIPIRLNDLDALRDWTLFDADLSKDLAAEIREYFIPDFSRWKHRETYRTAFARLLDGLRKTDVP